MTWLRPARLCAGAQTRRTFGLKLRLRTGATTMYANHPTSLDPWPAALAALAGIVLFGLLIAFVQVVRAGVAEGDLRRRAVAEDANAVWRCNALPGNADREACAARLKVVRAAIDSRRP